MVLSAEQRVKREKTLLVAILLSMWAPLTTGIAVLLSRSTTQLADFVRRTVELVALILSWHVFRRVERDEALSSEERARMERVAGIGVAAALFCSGTVILILTLSRISRFEPGGNVYPGLVIAGLGLITNSWFWRRYTALNRESWSEVIDGQRRLYLSKALVDLCVIAALSSIAVNPSHIVTRYVDILGSIAVALYMLQSGLRASRTGIDATDDAPGSRDI